MEHLVGKKFRLGRKIGSGSFGEIHLGSSFFLPSFEIFSNLLPNIIVGVSFRYSYSNQRRSGHQACEFFSLLCFTDSLLLYKSNLVYLLILLQENAKTKHPQLLYESKLYKLLQGGSKHFVSDQTISVFVLSYTCP